MANYDPALNPSAGRRMSVPQIIAAAIGAIYTLIGLAGFIATGFDGFASSQGDSLLGFEVNPLHNIVHVVIGVVGLLMSRSLSAARAFGWLLFIGYGLVFLYGLFVDKNSDANFLALNNADNVLHVLSALAGLLIALLPVRRVGAAESMLGRTRPSGTR